MRAAKRQISWIDSGPRSLRRILALEDFQLAAKRVLPRSIFEFIAGASETGSSARANLEHFQQLQFIPESLIDTANRSCGVSLFGKQYSAPFGIAPMGGSGLAGFQADLIFARAAAESSLPFILSASSFVRLEEVRAAGKTSWFQAYLPGEPDRIEAMVERVASAGFDTLVLTVDVPVLGNRENNIRSGFSMPLQPSVRLFWEGFTHPRWLLATVCQTLVRSGMPHFENMDVERGVPILSADLVRLVGKRDGLTWDHLEMMRRRWSGKLILKGVLSPHDAYRAAALDVDGIIVSNHGGRQLDGSIAPIAALPSIIAKAGNMVVMLDGGIRRGTDVLKALALGAKFVFVGRPFLFAAAVAQDTGVKHAIRLLAEELDRDMALLGIPDLNQIGSNFIHRQLR